LVGRVHRLILEDLTTALPPGPRTVVDVGSGPGALTAAIGRLRPDIQAIGVEPNARMLEIARSSLVGSNVRFEQGSAEQLPLPSGTVDALVSSLSVHHWSDLPTAVSEVLRVLRPRGIAWLYDIRFATATGEELDAAAAKLELPDGVISRRIAGRQGTRRLLARIELTPSAEPIHGREPAAGAGPDLR
jgi:ubiquinone/menaquinone biosynthesis C-methylase UbiE